MRSESRNRCLLHGCLRSEQFCRVAWFSLAHADDSQRDFDVQLNHVARIHDLTAVPKAIGNADLYLHGGLGNAGDGCEGAGNHRPSIEADPAADTDDAVLMAGEGVD